MSPHKKQILWPIFVFTVVLTCILVYATAGVFSHKNAAPALAQSNRVSVEAQQRYVRRGRLWPQLRWNLDALGNRLELSGKERMALTGTAKQTDRIQPSVFTFIWELPGRARLTIQDEAGSRTLGFNGQSVQAVGHMEERDRMLLETLIYDSAERCFVAVQELPSRLIGQRFRTDDGTTTDYSGPFFDIYQVGDIVRTEATPRPQTKLYYFNSDTQLLELIRYTTERHGTPTRVEIQIGQWSRFVDQQVAQRISRLENDSTVLTININAVVIGPRVNDGLFATP